MEKDISFYEAIFFKCGSMNAYGNVNTSRINNFLYHKFNIETNSGKLHK